MTHRGLFTPPASAPKTSNERNQAAMSKALDLVALALLLYNKAVLRARNLQARHIVDALHNRYRYQLGRNQTTLSFGRWVLEKRNLQSTYVAFGAEHALRLFGGIATQALTDPRFRFSSELEARTDWLTPLIQVYLNRRITELYYTVRVTSYTVPFTGQKEALPSLSFVEDLVAGQHAA